MGNVGVNIARVVRPPSDVVPTTGYWAFFEWSSGGIGAVDQIRVCEYDNGTFVNEVSVNNLTGAPNGTTGAPDIGRFGRALWVPGMEDPFLLWYADSSQRLLLAQGGIDSVSSVDAARRWYGAPCLDRATGEFFMVQTENRNPLANRLRLWKRGGSFSHTTTELSVVDSAALAVSSLADGANMLMFPWMDGENVYAVFKEDGDPRIYTFPRDGSTPSQAEAVNAGVATTCHGSPAWNAQAGRILGGPANLVPATPLVGMDKFVMRWMPGDAAAVSYWPTTEGDLEDDIGVDWRFAEPDYPVNPAQCLMPQFSLGGTWFGAAVSLGGGFIHFYKRDRVIGAVAPEPAIKFEVAPHPTIGGGTLQPCYFVMKD